MLLLNMGEENLGLRKEKQKAESGYHMLHYSSLCCLACPRHESAKWPNLYRIVHRMCSLLPQHCVFIASS